MKAKIIALAEKIESLKPHLKTEEATKNALVMPFIQALGYNVFDPLEVIPELVADHGVKKGEKVDYAIKHNGKITILIECKPISAKLSAANMSQLYRYFSVTHARIAILTNGQQYLVYSDLDKQNVMDQKPFYVFDLSDLRDENFEEIGKLAKDTFDLEVMLSSANMLKHTRQIKEAINTEFDAPSTDFVKLIFNKVEPKGRFTAENRKLFEELTLGAIGELIREKVNAKLRLALASQGDTHVSYDRPKIPSSEVEKKTEEIVDDGIETTEEELEGYHIVKSIVRQVVAPERIVYRDTKSYFGILLDDNNRKPICRLRFNSKTNYLVTFDENREEVRHGLIKLNDIYAFEEQLKATASAYDS